MAKAKAKRKAAGKRATVKPKGHRAPSGTDRLTGKQRLFVAYYLGESKGNATDAARRAGYAWADRVGPRLVGKSSVRAAIDAKLDAVGMTADEILAGLTDHATASIEDFIKVDGRGVAFDFARAKALGRLKCLRKLKRGKFGWEIELYDAQAAMDKLAKIRGMYGDSGPADDQVTVERIARSRALRDARAARKAIGP